MMTMQPDIKGNWRTIRGRKVFIKDDNGTAVLGQKEFERYHEAWQPSNWNGRGGWEYDSGPRQKNPRQAWDEKPEPYNPNERLPWDEKAPENEMFKQAVKRLQLYHSRGLFNHEGNGKHFAEIGDVLGDYLGTTFGRFNQSKFVQVIKHALRRFKPESEETTPTETNPAFEALMRRYNGEQRDPNAIPDNWVASKGKGMPYFDPEVFRNESVKQTGTNSWVTSDGFTPTTIKQPATRVTVLYIDTKGSDPGRKFGHIAVNVDGVVYNKFTDRANNLCC
jgi:hypothetical protein